MPIDNNALVRPAGLLAAVQALRNVRAATLLLLTCAGAAMARALGSVLAAHVHPLLGVPVSLAALLVLLYGGNAVGIMLMDEARGGNSRPMRAALHASFATTHRVAVALLGVAAVYLVGLLAITLVLFLCKVPYLGPLLYAFAIPVCVVVAGVAVFALLGVIAPLAAPAVWSGATALQAVSCMGVIARERVVGVVLSMLLLLLLALAVGGVVGGVLGAGAWVAHGLSAAILGTGALGPGALVGGLNASAASGYAAAAGVAGGLLGALAITPPLLVYLRGCCQVYLANVDSVDVNGVAQRLRLSLQAARRKAQDLRVRGEAKPAAPMAAAGPQATAMAAGCPGCGAACAADDMFCGTCGHRLS